MNPLLRIIGGRFRLLDESIAIYYDCGGGGEGKKTTANRKRKHFETTPSHRLTVEFTVCLPPVSADQRSTTKKRQII